MDDAGTTELIFILAVIAVLFLFGVAGCVLFYLTWRKEKKKDKHRDTA